MKFCSIDGCGKPHIARGLCGAHYQRWRIHGDPMSGNPQRGNVQRYFRDVVMAYEGDECFPWPFAKNKKGYGIILHNRRSRIVSRLICEEEHGPPPTSEHQAAHSCGNGHLACVTKRHLRWATQSENQADRLAHGTHARGERCWSAKLTWDDVREIRALRGVLPQREIASKYGVSNSGISNIQAGKTWRDAVEMGR